MTRSRSRYVPLWHSLPGCEAAYLPVRAPSHLHARWNIALHEARVGQNNATLGVAPTWTPWRGWGFNGTTQYLMTGITPVNNQSWTMIIRFADSTGGTGTYFAGCTIAGSVPTLILTGRSNLRAYGNGGTVVVNTALTFGVLGVSGNQGYANGVADGAAISVVTGSFGPMDIGCAWNGTTHASFAPYNNLATAIYSRPLTPAEMWLASLQMKYCNQNPEWNAWARRRNYWIVPVQVTAGGRVGIYGARPTIGLPGGVSIRPGSGGVM